MKNVPYIITCILGVFLFKIALVDNVNAKPTNTKELWRGLASEKTRTK